MKNRISSKSFFLTALLSLTGCTDNPSMLFHLAGPDAEQTKNLFWYIFGVESLVWVLVLGTLFYFLNKRKTVAMATPEHPSPQTERRAMIVVGGAVACTILILTSFVGVSYFVDRKLIGFEEHPEMTIEVTAHQWWWELRYMSDVPSEIFITANEIHIPTNTKVKLELKSVDVIHSLWFPNLSGKKDIIPGHDRNLVIEANEEGMWYGRCAEFCGMQHAQMGLKLFAEPKEKFEAWKKAQLEPAPEPQTTEEKRGREVFTTGSCTLCHVIRGTEAKGYSSNAPDLTHLKSRTTIGAGAADNTKGYLGGWIADPHGIKPGVHMPTILQDPKDFQALLNYLETLK